MQILNRSRKAKPKTTLTKQLVVTRRPLNISANPKRRRQLHNKEYIYGYPFTNPESFEVNWCSPDAIHESVNCFTNHQASLFKILKIKKEKYSKGFDKGNYFHNSYALVAANCCYADRIVFCGRKNEWNGSGCCQKWHFCRRCAYIRSQKALKMYLSAFNEHEFLTSTMSFTGCLVADNATDINGVISYWEAIKDAVYTMREEGRMLGAYFTEELTLLGLSPIRLIPHLHCIFHVDDSVDAKVGDLSIRLAQAGMESATRHNRKLLLEPSVVVERIRDEEHFANSLQYLTKAIELKHPYEQARDSFPPVTTLLNQELQTFLKGYLTAAGNRLTVRRIGTMHPGSTHFVGKRWSKRQNEEYVRDYFNERKSERKDSDLGQD